MTLGRMLVSGLRSWWWLAVLLLAWDLYVELKDFNVIVLPDPWTVARALVNDWPTLGAKLLLTLRAAVAGLLAGALLGTIVAVLA